MMPSTGTVNATGVLPGDDGFVGAGNGRESVSFLARMSARIERFFASGVGLWVGIYLLVLTPATIAGAFALQMASSPVDLGRATVFTSTVNGAAMVEFPDGQVAPASVSNVADGDSVTVFLNGSTVTNDPMFPSEIALLWALAAGAVGLAAAVMFMVWHTFASSTSRLTRMARY